MRVPNYKSYNKLYNLGHSEPKGQRSHAVGGFASGENLTQSVTLSGAKSLDSSVATLLQNDSDVGASGAFA